MEKNQFKLCLEILKRLDEAGVLRHLVLIGSWCLPFYKEYFSGTSYHPSLRTRDIDFLVPRPTLIRSKLDLADLLKDLGFVLDFKGEHGVMQLAHPDLVLELLVPERGRGTEKPFPLPQLTFNAQALRFLDFLSSNTMTVHQKHFTIILPHPARFALHKLIVSQRRKNEDKMMKDRDTAVSLLKALVEKGESQVIKDAFHSAPPGWRRKIIEGLKKADEQPFIELLSS